MKFFQSLSLKKRLLILLLSLIAIVWGLVTISAYHTIRSEMSKLLDTQIAQVAYSLLEINFDKIYEYEAKIPDDVNRFLREDSDNLDIRYQVWKDETLQLHSLAAPNYRLEISEGFNDYEMENDRWRILYISVPGKINIDVVVMARRDIESLFLHPLSELVLLHMAAQMILITLIVWFAVGRGLWPLKTLAGAIGRRHYNDLSPLEEHTVPEEMKPVVSSLNRLFDRLRESFESEKQFTNHAAHELRTPLAALKMQAQVAMREKDPDKQRKQLQNIVLGVNRATHLVSQLLSIARLEPESEKRLEMKIVALDKIIRSVVNDIEMLPAPKNIKFHLPEQLETTINGDPASLEILVKNLLDNAVRYSPKNSNIYIRLHDMKDWLELVIDDEGPGIPVNLREKVFDRFYRIPGSKSEGIGIGLSIVKKITELHKAELVIDNAMGDSGTRIIVRFPKHKE